MSWSRFLQDASFKGVAFEVMSVSRSGQRAIATNEYPYLNGADLEDIGLRARRITLKVVVYGEYYEAQLATLVEALESDGAGELVHPVHGRLRAMAESWTDEHEAELVDGAVLNVTFVEDTTRAGALFVAPTADVEAITTQAAVARAAADDALVRRVQAVNTPPSRLAFLKDAFNQAKALLKKFSDTSALRAVLSDLDPLIYPRAYAADLVAVVDRALQGLPFGGRNLLYDSAAGADETAGSGAKDMDLASTLLDPAAMGVKAGAKDEAVMADAAAVQAHLRVYAACAIAECAAIVLTGEKDEALLARTEIEQLANGVRTDLQVALDAARDALDAEGRGQTASALQALAFAVQGAALAVINQQPPLVSRASPVAGPLRLVAHALYGDASRAGEIARLNRLGRNALVDNGEVLNVYAA
jgi:prophage DNA circulation protein